MLPQNLFEQHEPRNVFPFFKDFNNHINYVFRENVSQNTIAVSKYIAKRFIRGRDLTESNKLFRRILLDSFRGIEINFRGAFLNNDGQLICLFPNICKVKYGQGFDISINELLIKKNIDLQNGQFLLIADRGLKLVPQSYTTGTISAVYMNQHSYTCYRNGIFARSVNDFNHHRPKGFRSIAPHMFANNEVEASAYFFNFSSDLKYSETVNPKVKIYNSENKFLEGEFGEIKAFGAMEKSLTDIFGIKIIDFLATGNGNGTLIAEEPGHTLGSIHLLKNKYTKSMSMEHTRPTHMYVV